MKKLFLAVAICALTVVSVNAQVIKGSEAQTKRGPYETNRFFDNVFIGVSGGVNLYQGEQDHDLDFSKRLAPAVNAYVGKWITPSVGVRIGYNGFRTYGVTTDANNPYVTKSIKAKYAGSYKQEMNYNFIHADFMWNLSNAIGGYRADRFWDIAPYVGGGWMWNATKKKVNGSYNHNHELGIIGGIYNMFRLSQALDLTLDVSQTYVNERFDGQVSNKRHEFIGTVTLGLAYNFKVREFSRAHAAVDVTPYNNKINDLNNALTAANNKIAQLQKDLAEANAKPAKEVYVEKVVGTPSPMAVYFPIGKSTLTQAQELNLKFYVENAIKTNPDHVFTVTGSADSATGSKSTNDRLGQARMQKVYDLLVNKFGVDASKLEKKSIGGTDKYGLPIQVNRCVVIE